MIRVRTKRASAPLAVAILAFVAALACAAPAAAAPCKYTPGADGLIIEAAVLRTQGVMRNGQVLIGADGKIACVAKRCAGAGAALLKCPHLVLSPGMINTHDHLAFTGVAPIAHPGELYAHRHEWRKGLNGHKSIEPPSAKPGDVDVLAWGELRFLVGGTTSTIGGAMAPGLLRNLDFKDGLERLQTAPALYRTFPLGDGAGIMQTANCDYGPTPTTRADIGPGAMIAHVAEGTGAAARNEFLCESSDTYDTLPLPAGGGVSHDWIVPNAALIHAVGLQKQDLKLVAARGASLIWSPRSNFSLYGKTLRLGDAEKLQINIALGADWLPSGSMNLNRELACASAYAAHLIHPLSDEDLWRMVTINAARAAHVDDALGAIEPGKTADLILVSRRGSNSFRAVTASTPASVQMVMRGGVVLYGNTAIVNALRPDCEAIAVAGATRALCPEAARPSAHALQAYADDTHIYPLAFKGRPANEPACWAQTGSRR